MRDKTACRSALPYNTDAFGSERFTKEQATGCTGFFTLSRVGESFASNLNIFIRRCGRAMREVVVTPGPSSDHRSRFGSVQELEVHMPAGRQTVGAEG
eukprot:scaffold436203_cov31-Prasinocladus_malaysianus.AAC.1